MSRLASLATGAAFAAVAWTAASPARAVECATLPRPIYGTGGSATKPLLAKFGAGLSAAPEPRTVVYQSPGACIGLNALLGKTKLTGTANYWDASGTEQTCDLATTGDDVDFANLGNSATSCPGVATLPSDVGDFIGAANTYDLIVPKASSQTSISAEAAYFVFGFGQQGKVQPWVDETQIYRRNSTAAVQLFIALATGVPVEKFKGVDTKNNQGTVNAVAQSPSPEAAIGLVSGEVADANRASVRVLAYQHFGQSCGYLPDSSPTAFDKRNVRDGHYYIWAPIHFYARVDDKKAIVDPDTRYFVELFTGKSTPPPNLNVLEAEIKAGNIPKCAMSVWRDTDLGPIQSYVPDDPCGCYFESLTNGTTSCQACSASDTCPSTAPACRHGFCEAR